ncbi:MAG: riboflavin synthase [Dehalococcoidales bacterium]|nr:riboflavin synthase [Dehalococcoidales bacterium]MDD3265452.1 riboflavin synthase [Dehalococcoidales bacterium]MDD4322923.1 riboflavin synthase [Dehalococcoidales bacterium]MDD5122587.1 riboflavin synthase [Dehalococcoidales bacterium]MDD5499095.1 riboflavin synthase [Dehalococcoidales bacterium]
MFTGIVEETGVLSARQSNSLSFKASKVLEGLQIGDSIAVNGICLTVVSFNNEGFSVEVMPETIKRSNLGLVEIGGRVNLERALTLSKPLGGHFVQGHVDGTGRVKEVSEISGATIIKLVAPSSIMRYIVDKGFIAVDGISLTVVQQSGDEITLSIVGHSLANTTLGTAKAGSVVNLEADILAKYVEKYTGRPEAGLDMDFLAEHGFTA